MAQIGSVIQGYLDRKGHAYTVTANGTATLSGTTLDARELEDLVRAASSGGYAVSLVSGVVTVKPR